jgi:hypothetical protein
MSFGGTVLAMIISLRNNARPKRKAFEDIKDFERRIKFSNDPLKFNEASKEDLEKIKQKIRIDAKKYNRRLVIINVVFGLFFLAFLFFYLMKLSQITEDERNRVRNIEEKELRILNDKYNFLINDGYEWIENGNYHNAKYQFKEASKIKPDEFTSIIATLRAYVFDCIENNVKCRTAEHLLTKCLTDYPEDIEVLELARLFDHNKK